MRYYILIGFIASFFVSCLFKSPAEGEKIVFYGSILKSNTDGIIVESSNKQFVIVFVELLPYKIILGNINIDQKITIAFYINANSDEGLKIDKESLLKWDFHKSNKLHVQAVYKKDNFIEEVNSIQDHPCIEWAKDVGQ